MIELLLSDGSEVQISVSTISSDFALNNLEKNVNKSLKEVVETGAKILKESIEVIKNSFEEVKPSSLEIEIGLSVSHEGSIIITSGSVEASISVKAIWKFKESI